MKHYTNIFFSTLTLLHLTVAAPRTVTVNFDELPTNDLNDGTIPTYYKELFFIGGMNQIHNTTGELDVTLTSNPNYVKVPVPSWDTPGLQAGPILFKLKSVSVRTYLGVDFYEPMILVVKSWPRTSQSWDPLETRTRNVVLAGDGLVNLQFHFQSYAAQFFFELFGTRNGGYFHLPFVMDDLVVEFES